MCHILLCYCVEISYSVNCINNSLNDKIMNCNTIRGYCACRNFNFVAIKVESEMSGGVFLLK